FPSRRRHTRSKRDWSSDVCSSDLGFKFNEKLMRTGFWGLNAGLVLMIVTSLFPIGLIQFYASATEGMWYARSEEFMQQSILQTLRWVRTFGDVVFIVGAFAVAWQVILGLLPSKGRGSQTAPITATKEVVK